MHGREGQPDGQAGGRAACRQDKADAVRVAKSTTDIMSLLCVSSISKEL